MGEQHPDKDAQPAGRAPEQPPEHSNQYLAFVLSLIGGILITLGAVLGTSIGIIGGPYGYGPFGGMMGGYGGILGGMMGGYYYGGGYGGIGPGMMSGFYGGYYGSLGNYYTPLILGLTVIGLVAGIIVLVAALYMRNRPVSEARMLGVIILVFSIIGIVTVGGFFLIGGVLGIVGGIIALSTHT